jgi:hypothetical protein
VLAAGASENRNPSGKKRRNSEETKRAKALKADSIRMLYNALRQDIIHFAFTETCFDSDMIVEYARGDMRECRVNRLDRQEGRRGRQAREKAKGERQREASKDDALLSRITLQ